MFLEQILVLYAQVTDCSYDGMMTLMKGLNLIAKTT
jgi:hypothetical protein